MSRLLDNSFIKAISLMLVLVSMAYGSALMAEERVQVIADNASLMGVGSGLALNMTIGGWGPKWSYLNFKGSIKNENGTAVARNTSKLKKSKIALQYDWRAQTEGEKTLILNYALTADTDTELTLVMVATTPGKKWQGTIEATLVDGTTVTKTWPLNKAGLGEGVQSMRLIDANGLQTTFTFDPAVAIPYDRGEMRIVVAKKLKAGIAKKLQIRVEFPTAIVFYPTPADAPAEKGKEFWFEWKPQYNYTENNAIGLGDWQSEAAGSKGRIASVGDQLIYDGKPIKLWGLNTCFSACAPDKETADRRATFYAQNGVNAVRLHKYADGAGWAGILQKSTMTDFDPAGLDRMDYYIAALVKKGIFVKLSPSFGSPAIGPADYDAISYASEWGKKPKDGKRLKTGGASIFLSKELQDMQITQMRNLPKHVNPYLNKSYADEPGIMLIELVNEESALFYSTIRQLKDRPSLRKVIAAQFTDWLLECYGNEAAVIARWGKGGLGTFVGEGFGEESFADKSVTPAGNPWFWDIDNINGSQKDRAPRLYDAALFLKELQDAYYDRYRQAIRDAGYTGELMASNWGALNIKQTDISIFSVFTA